MLLHRKCRCGLVNLVLFNARMAKREDMLNINIEVANLLQLLKAFAYCNYNGDCTDDRCESCSDYVINYSRVDEWFRGLLNQNGENPIITNEERIILKNLPNNFKYIARNRGIEQALYIFEMSPKLNTDGFFNHHSHQMPLNQFRHIFKGIEPGKAYSISILINENNISIAD